MKPKTTIISAHLAMLITKLATRRIMRLSSHLSQIYRLRRKVTRETHNRVGNRWKTSLITIATTSSWIKIKLTKMNWMNCSTLISMRQWKQIRAESQAHLTNGIISKSSQIISSQAAGIANKIIRRDSLIMIMKVVMTMIVMITVRIKSLVYLSTRLKVVAQ